MRTPLDYSGPQAALAWFVLLSVLVGLIALLMWLLDVAGQWVTRAEPEPEPEPEPTPGTVLRACVVINGRAVHHYRLTCDSEGVEWYACGRCGETVRRAA